MSFLTRIADKTQKIKTGVSGLFTKKPLIPAPAVSPQTTAPPVLSEAERIKLAVEGMKSLRRSLLGAFWWTHVQDEVKGKIEKLLEHVIVVGPLFRDAFISGFRYEHARRLLDGEAVPNEVPGALFGKAMGEESYQCGIKATRLALNLNDWIEPNDADVQACMVICHKVDEMQKNGVIQEVKSEAPSWTANKVAVNSIEDQQ